MVYFIRYITPNTENGIRYIMPGPRWYILLGILYLLSNSVLGILFQDHDGIFY